MVPLIALGCVIGEIIRRSGGSEVLGEKMLQRIGNKRGPLAMTMCGLLVGSTIFFDTAVILLAPVTIAVARQSKKSIIFFAVPMAIAVLGMHSIIPPHPGAVAIATALNVNFGLLIMYGLLAMLRRWPLRSSIPSGWPGGSLPTAPLIWTRRTTAAPPFPFPPRLRRGIPRDLRTPAAARMVSHAPAGSPPRSRQSRPQH